MANISFSYVNPFKSRFGESHLKSAPERPGVYFFLNSEDEILYIGKADNIKKRLYQYAQAKPGTVKAHTLELIELIEQIKFEFHETGKEALAREADLIRLIKPPFNIAGKDSVPYLYIGSSFDDSPKEQISIVNFRLSYSELLPQFQSYGCFRKLGRTKSAYSALLRLIYATSCTRPRFLIPSKISRTSPAYIHKGLIRTEMVKPLHLYLEGKSLDLLKLITQQLLQQDNVQPHLYAPLQRDLNTLKEFFEVGLQELLEIKKAANIKSATISKQKIDSFIEHRIKKDLPNFIEA